MQEYSNNFEKLLNLCINLESTSYLHFRLTKDLKKVEWKEVEDIAFSIHQILSTSNAEIPLSTKIIARRLASYLIGMDTMSFGLITMQNEESLFGNEITRKISKDVLEIENSFLRGKRKEIIEELKYSFPSDIFSKEITEIINMTYNEVLIDFENKCYFSSISLCGKIIETVLSALYYKVFQKDSDEEKLGIDAISNRLKKSGGYEFKGTLKEQFKIITASRNKAVHGSIIVPTIDEARGVISFTRDVLQKASSK